MSKNKQIFGGAILSYVLLFVNTLSSLFLTPYILSYVGESSYGVYKSIAALSASLAVMDLGLGATMMRYISKYNALNDKKGAQNFVAMILLQYLMLSMCIIAIGIGFFFLIKPIYSSSFNGEEIELAKKLLLILVLNLVLRLFENLLFGIASGYEKFTFSNSIKLITIVLKISLVFVLLPFFNNILLVVLLETAMVTISIICFLIVIFRKIKLIPKLYKWDWAVFRESFGYTALMFIQSITVQFNGNIDNVLIGAQINSASVTLYSMALMIFGMYENLSGQIANLMLPRVTNKIVNNASVCELQNSVENAGRFQFMLLAAALGGFIVLGKEFFTLWLGNGYEDCFYLTLILIIPVTFPMVQNVSLSILRAQNKMGYRTITLAISCIINIIVTIVGIHYLGYWGAAIGTAISTLSNLIFMNYYYKKKLNFKIFKMFSKIFSRTFLCSIVAAITTFVIHLYLNGSWGSFIINAGIFMIIYLMLLILIEFKKEEKTLIFKTFIKRR